MTVRLAHEMRDVWAADWPFLKHAWLKALLAEPAYRLVPRDILTREHGGMIECLTMPKYDGIALIAHEPGNPDHFYGFVSATKGLAVHWVYVKSVYWRMGVGSSLLAAARARGVPAICTHATESTASLIGKYGLTYNPYELQRHWALAEGTSHF